MGSKQSQIKLRMCSFPKSYLNQMYQETITSLLLGVCTWGLFKSAKVIRECKLTRMQMIMVKIAIKLQVLVLEIFRWINFISTSKRSFIDDMDLWHNALSTDAVNREWCTREIKVINKNTHTKVDSNSIQTNSVIAKSKPLHYKVLCW